MSVGNWAEDQLLDALFNGEATDLPVTTPYVKLHLGDPTDDGSGSPAAETTRQAASFGAASGGVSTSDADITWTSVSASETYSHISLWDASTGGNCLWHGALTASKAVNSGDTFTIASGDLTISLE